MTLIEHLRDVPNSRDDDGFGSLRTDRGNLPLHRLDVRATISGLTAAIELTQGFRNPYDVPLEATYVFPLPDRAALTGLRMTAGDRVITGVLEERASARQHYDEAIAAGRRASIAEEERPDVFTLRVGNILPGEQVTVALTLAGPLPFADGQAEFRFPLVVAPRYIPGTPLPGEPVGDGYAPDTAAVPDASRITPPVLLPGFPNPVDLSIEVRLDPAGLPCTSVASSLHAVTEAGGVLRIRPGERVDRDFILRLGYGQAGAALALTPDREGDEGTYRLTVLPPEGAQPPRPKDLVLLLDRSGSMDGWKMIAARRAAARIVDTLGAGDRFAVLTFDHEIGHADGLPGGLVAGTDRNRYRAVEHLAGTDARGGTELLAPLREGLRLLADPRRDRVLVLVTDGQVGNEDELLRVAAGDGSGVRLHSVGIDRAVNAGFLGRLATIGAGRCELVESEDRLDEAMERIHRRIAAPLVTGVRLHAEGLDVIDGTGAPARVPDLFPGVPLVVSGRYRGAAGGTVTVTGTDRAGGPWRTEVPATVADTPASGAIWARAHLRDLEDRYAVTGAGELERDIVATSLRFGVLCRFTAYVAVDPSVVTDEGGPVHRVVQPVEMPSGWEAAATRLSSFAVSAEMPMRGGAASARRSVRGRPRRPQDSPDRSAAPVGYGFNPPAPGGLPKLPPPAPPFVPAPAAPAGIPAPAEPAGVPASAAPVGVPASPVAPPPVPAPGPAGGGRAAAPSAEVSVARLAGQEAAALRAAAGEPEAHRAELLDDLASRLGAQAAWLRSGPVADALRALVTALRDEAVPVRERWERALTVLDELAAGGPMAGGSAAGGPAAKGSAAEEGEPSRRRDAFWRRPQ